MFNLLNKKIGEPLNTINANCKNIENSKSLKMLEELNLDGDTRQFKNQIKAMRTFSDIMIYRLKDMQDFQDINLERFRKLNSKFDLKACLEEVKEMMEVKANLKNVNLVLNPVEFENDMIKLL